MNELLRHIPSVDSLLQAPESALLLETFGRGAVLEAMREMLEGVRAEIKEGGSLPDSSVLLARSETALEARFRLTLRPLINATGVILHTNLGRAPLAESAIEAVRETVSGYSNLEFNLADGQRGKRQSHIENLVAEVIGAEAAMVVNNCASALLIVLSALAREREVIISRGQLVEIGGGFRVPAVMEQSGAKLVEVGTTNRTRIADYERAIGEETALLMRVHASNFKVVGFTEEASLAALADLAHDHNLTLVDDLGSGALLDTADFGLAHEPTVGESLAAGADVITFSGDKLLGGPQAGLIAGKKAVLDELKRHPLARALRVDKMTIAALVATLDIYRREGALTHIPIWRMIAKSLEEIQKQAEDWAQLVGGEVIEGESTVGGGSLPGETLPTVHCVLDVESPAKVQALLRENDPPVIVRVKDDRVLLDPRTVAEHEIPTVSAALKAVLGR